MKSNILKIIYGINVKREPLTDDIFAIKSILIAWTDSWLYFQGIFAVQLPLHCRLRRLDGA